MFCVYWGVCKRYSFIFYILSETLAQQGRMKQSTLLSSNGNKRSADPTLGTIRAKKEIMKE